jgi:hypothetical protein
MSEREELEAEIKAIEEAGLLLALQTPENRRRHLATALLSSGYTKGNGELVEAVREAHEARKLMATVESGAPFRSANRQLEDALSRAFKLALSDSEAKSDAGNLGSPDESQNGLSLTDAGSVNVNLAVFLTRQQAWQAETYGPNASREGVIKHIRKELVEIEDAPGDLTEWVDVAFLAFDGARRDGFSPDDIAAAFLAKQTVIEGRIYRDWRTLDSTQPIEHVRDSEATNGDHHDE